MGAMKRAAADMSQVLGFDGNINDAIIGLMAKIGEKINFKHSNFPAHAKAVLSKNHLWPKNYQDKSGWIWKRDKKGWYIDLVMNSDKASKLAHRFKEPDLIDYKTFGFIVNYDDPKQPRKRFYCEYVLSARILRKGEGGVVSILRVRGIPADNGRFL